MAKLTINGKTVTVDDSFLKLSPQDQDSTVNEIASSMGLNRPITSKSESNPAAQRGSVDFLANGLTGGAMDKARAGIRSIMRWTPYDDAIKEVRQETEAARIASPKTAISSEAMGSVLLGGGAASAGLTASRFIPGTIAGGKRLGALMSAGAVDGAALGAINGVGYTDDGNYAGNVAKQAGVGALFGGAAPVIAAGASTATKPVRDAIAAHFSPDTYARKLAVNAMDRANMTPSDVRAKMLGADADGQTAYTVADALGSAGARTLNGVARGSAPSSSGVRDTMLTRQAEQGGRIESIIRDGLDAPTTAKQLVDRLTTIRARKGNAEYGAARDAAGAVDPTAAIRSIDQIARPDVLGGLTSGGLSDASPIRALQNARGLLTDGKTMVSDFDRALLAKFEMDKAIQSGTNALTPARRALDDALASASAPYAAARNTYRNLSNAIDAVDVGRMAGQRGIAADTAETFGKMKPQEAGAARYGYADALIERSQRLAEGANKGRALSADKYKQEFGAVAAPGRADQMQRRLGREAEMFDTSRTVTGGSNTAQNLVDLGLVGATSGGDYFGYLPGGTQAGIMLAAARRGAAHLAGNPSEAATKAIVDALLSRNPNVLAGMAARQVKSRAVSEETVNAMTRALLGASVGSASQGKP